MRRPAFTLIEMVVTVSILALLSAFVVPTYQLILSQFQLASTANEVADFFRLTEQKTVSEQVLYGITLTTNASTIPQFSFDPNTSAKTTTTTYTLPSWIRISQVNFSSATDVRFSSSGAPTVSGNIVLTDTIRGRNRIVEIRPSGAIFANQGEY